MGVASYQSAEDVRDTVEEEVAMIRDSSVMPLADLVALLKEHLATLEAALAAGEEF